MCIRDRLGVHRLAASADRAYLHGMGLALVVCGVAALVAGVLTAVFLPNPRGGSHPGTTGHPRTGTAMATGTSHARE